MKYLFVHQNFPGQYLHIVRHLVASHQHDVVFLTEPNANQIPGVRKVPYPKPNGPAQETHVAARELDGAMRPHGGRQVRDVCAAPTSLRTPPPI